MEGIDHHVDEMQRGQADIWEVMYSHVDSLVLKCAVELRIADIIHSHGCPITLSQIASSISGSSSPNIHYLQRILRLLVCKKIFTAHRDDHDSSSGDYHHQTRYGLTEKSRWIMWESKPSLAPVIMMQNRRLTIDAFDHLSDSVRHGVVPYKAAFGHDFVGESTVDPKSNKWFKDGMINLANMVMDPVLSALKNEFSSMGSLIDVGGFTGETVYEIVKAHPHIKGFNFDLPDIIAMAPSYDGVTHVVGDMFEAIPSADAIFMKKVLNNWTDEQCIKILRNCRKSIPEKTGKVIIVDIVLESLESNDVDFLYDEMRIRFDLGLMALRGVARERTELEWKKLLEEAGFPHYKIIKIPAMPSIIEAYPV
uniref:ASMT20 n=1 Tax=Morus alba TaxID=3498 RepID=A0A872TM34_MORAL|nr:ASMT20 [Morus alba]